MQALSFLLLVKSIDLSLGLGDFGASLVGLMLADGVGRVIKETHFVLFVIFHVGVALGATEEVIVFLLGEVNIVVTMSVGVNCGVVPVVLPSGVGSHVSGLTVIPSLELEVRDTALCVEVGDGHGTLVSIIVDHFSTHEPLLLFAETLKDMLGTDLHNADFVCETGILVARGDTVLVVADFLVATTGNHSGSEGHVLGVLHGGGAETTILVTEGLGLAIGEPFVVGLVVSMPLLEGVIQIAVQPVELGHHTKEEGHLRVFVRLVFVALTDRIK